MTHSKNNLDIPKKDNSKLSKSQKHEVNLKTNSTIYFQVGLIVCLLISYALFETSFQTTEVSVQLPLQWQVEQLYVYNEPIKIYKEPTEVEPKKKEPVVFRNPIIKEDDNDALIESPIVVLESTTNEPPMEPGKISVIEKPVDLPPVNIMAVEQVPIFPGCENATSNEARRECMSEKITKHVQKKFNTNVADNLGLKGEQRIYVTFKIDKTGYITNIKTKSKYGELDKESERVIEKLPQMTPGRQENKNVEVLYSLPINLIY